MTIPEMMERYRNDGSCEGIIKTALEAFFVPKSVDPNNCGGHMFVWRADCLDCSICGREHPQGFQAVVAHPLPATEESR